MRSNLIEAISIDRRSAVSFTEQIKESIKALILDQTFYYQAVLPNPAHLAKHLHIETKEVQSAYDELVDVRYIRDISKSVQMMIMKLHILN